MLKKILHKRTRKEIEEWEKVRELMPRKSDTRGLQFEVLEYLFENLYEHVSEEQIREYLLNLRGHLQKTGDPVKSAINMALKELQRLRNPTFELIKIQEPNEDGILTRYVQLHFNLFDAVAGYQEYCDYLEDVLRDCNDWSFKSVYTVPVSWHPELFPGLTLENSPTLKVNALTNRIDLMKKPTSHLTTRLIPFSPANYNFFLLYEHEDSEIPFLGVVANISGEDNLENTQYLIYRGKDKLSKLRFLHRIWNNLFPQSFSFEEAHIIHQEALELQSTLPESSPLKNDFVLLQALLVNPKNRGGA